MAESLAESHFIPGSLAAQSVSSQPFLIQLPQNLLQGQLRQGSSLLHQRWTSGLLAAFHSRSIPRILQLCVVTLQWWAVLQTGIPVARVRRVRSWGVGLGVRHVHLLLCWSWVHEAWTVVSHLQRRMAPQGLDRGGLAAWLGPEASQGWAGAPSQWPPLLEPIHGAIVLLNGGVGWGALPIVAGFFHLLLHLCWVGWWRNLMRQMDWTDLRSPAGYSVRRRQCIADGAISLPQRLLGSFALQGASSSVLKPHLDRKERKKNRSLDSDQDI